MPRRRAARKMVSPARMSISRSSIVKVWPEELAEESWPWSPGCGLLLSLIMQTLDYQCPSGLVSSSGKYFNTHNKRSRAQTWLTAQLGSRAELLSDKCFEFFISELTSNACPNPRTESPPSGVRRNNVKSGSG